jgi:amino acid transporter
MDFALAVLVIMVAVAVAVAAMLAVRRRAPDGSFFSDGDRASGVFGVLATGFALLLGLIVFLAFTSYDESKTGAESEALAVVQQFETAQFLPAAARERLSGELICYGRSVIGQEWPRLETGSESGAVNPWGLAMFRTMQAVQPTTAAEQSAYDKWFDLTTTREEARRDRVHADEGVIPMPLWRAMFFIAALVVVYMLFFADSGERALVQGLLMGSIVAVMATTLLLIGVLDTPYRPGPGQLRPVAMEQTLALIDQARDALGQDDPPPCDAQGQPR